MAHEERVAELYEGVRSPSSGGADNDQGDVRTPLQLIECKYTGGPGEPIKRPKILKEMEKVALEAWTEDREPVLALRFFDPDSPLSGNDGYIDFTMRLQHEDVHRDRVFREALVAEAALDGG